MINSAAEVVPNMARGKKRGFGGKKAAPFVKGGGRSKKHPNDYKGRTRKKK